MKKKEGQTLNQVLGELSKRAHNSKLEAEKPKFILEEFCFDKQLAFIKDPAKFKTAVCSRRAGKTIACAADLVDTAKNTPEVNVLYLTLSRKSAKRIIWKELMKLNKDYQLGGKVDNVELSITLPNESVIHVSGAKDATEIEKYRGLALKKVYIDECQSFRAYIKELAEDVIGPALWDHDGTLCLIGTPGPVAAGFFYEETHNKENANYHWTIFDNPHIERLSGKKPEEILAADRKRRGVSESDPTYRRESLGQWVNDLDALVYKFDPNKNRTENIPRDNMTYVMGIDIGWKDADAIAMIGYDGASKNVYLVEEHVKSKQDITDLANKILELMDMYKPARIVMDAGALGKKIQEEIRKRHNIPVEAAEKHRKHEFIKLLNDDLRTAKFKAFPNSKFEQDSYLVQWNYDNPEKPKVSDVYHTDIGDAVLYAWRECYHYLYRREPDKPKVGTNEYMKAMEEKEMADFEARRTGANDYFADPDDVQALEDDLNSDW